MTFVTHDQTVASAVTDLSAYANGEYGDPGGLPEAIHLVLGHLADLEGGRREASVPATVEYTVWPSGVLVTSPAGVDVVAWDLDAFVAGEPVQKGSTKAFAIKAPHTKRGMRAVVTAENRPEQVNWTAFVRSALCEVWVTEDGRLRPPTADAVVVAIEFVHGRRKSAPRTYTPWKTTYPDLDKLERGTWDALTKVIYADDGQVVACSATKREAEQGETPGARIRVAVLPSRTKPTKGTST